MVTNVLKKTLLFLLLVGIHYSNVYAQDAKDEVQLTVSGYADNKEEATKIALRSAIEQAFGTFVSSNTEMLNDEIVKDEIATVSSGNIKSYEYISESIIEGKSSVTLKAIVSINKLVEYTKSKGGATELSGATFAMNMKMRKLNRQNEAMVLETLYNELFLMLPYLFDYEIEVKSPKVFEEGIYHCETHIRIKANKNTEIFYDKFHAVMNSISLSESEQAAYIEDNVDFCSLAYTKNTRIGNEIMRCRSIAELNKLMKRVSEFDNSIKVYSLRDYGNVSFFQKAIHLNILQGALLFRIIDNLGEYWFERSESYSSDYTTSSFGDNKIYFTPSSKQRFYLNSTPFISEQSSVGVMVFNRTQTLGSILGTKCSPGEDIYRISLYLCYTEDEIGKISEIKIEPLIAR